MPNCAVKYASVRLDGNISALTGIEVVQTVVAPGARVVPQESEVAGLLQTIPPSPRSSIRKVTLLEIPLISPLPVFLIVHCAET